MERIVGVETAHGFGDCLFNAPLIQALAAKYQCKVGIAVRAHCADAYANQPWVNEIITIAGLHQGHAALEGYQHRFQLTQNVKFFEFRQHDQHHSLIDTPLVTGRQLGVSFDQRPLINLTESELAAGDSIKTDRPIIAVESVFTSGQSWADIRAFEMILERYRDTHTILWLSNSGAPPYANDLLRFSRREIIGCLKKADRFFSVGSGFFCASLALPAHLQPREIVCMWIDDFYKYEGRLKQLCWHDNLKWVHSHAELAEVL